jgi:hypothetical protein
MNLSCNIAIGNLSFNFYCPSLSWLEFIKKNYGPFISGHTERSAVNITIKHGISRLSLPETLKILEKYSALRISRYDFNSISSSTFDSTVLLVEKNKYSFDSWFRVFFTLYGIKKNAVLIHGAGLIFRNKTFIFPGRSGRGKSTLIRIIGKENSLTDELVCVYRQNRNFYASSTPYWGELKKGAGKYFSRKLKAVLCPGHGNEVYTTKISSIETLRELLRTVLFFSTDARKMNKLLSFLNALSLNIPAHTLWFRKDSSKTDILSAISNVIREA